MKKFLYLLIILVAMALYLLTLRGEPGNPNAAQIKNNLDQSTRPFELSPERGRYAHIYNLAENGQYELSLEWAEAVYPDVGYHDGKYYSFFAPGVSYIALPFYILGSQYNLAQVFTFGFISLCAILGLFFIFKICNEIFNLPFSVSFLAALVFAFATTSWSYAITLYQHHLFTLLMLSGFYSVWRYSLGTRFGWLWGIIIWFNYGLAILIDYPNAILMLPVMVYFFIVSSKIENIDQKIKLGIRWGIIFTSIVFIAITIFHGYHNQKHFGSWKNLSGGIVGYKDIKEKNILTQENPEQKIAELQSKKNVSGFFREEKFPRGFFTLIFSRDRGLILFDPVLILGLIGLFLKKWKSNFEHGILMSLMVVNLFLYSSWGDPWGGWAFGPRYLIPSMAILSIYLGIFVNEFRAWWIKIILLLLLIYSSAIALLGALTTNAVPPKIEADYLHTEYNFLYNWNLFKAGNSGSYIFNTYLQDYISLTQYGLILLAITVLIFVVILFVLPKRIHESQRID